MGRAGEHQRECQNARTKIELGAQVSDAEKFESFSVGVKPEVNDLRREIFDAIATGGIEIQDWNEGAYKYKVALNVLGKKPEKK